MRIEAAATLIVLAYDYLYCVPFIVKVLNPDEIVALNAKVGIIRLHSYHINIFSLNFVILPDCTEQV
jgi:hypothetical protein